MTIEGLLPDCSRTALAFACSRTLGTAQASQLALVSSSGCHLSLHRRGCSKRDASGRSPEHYQNSDLPRSTAVKGSLLFKRGRNQKHQTISQPEKTLNLKPSPQTLNPKASKPPCNVNSRRCWGPCRSTPACFDFVTWTVSKVGIKKP